MFGKYLYYETAHNQKELVIRMVRKSLQYILHVYKNSRKDSHSGNSRSEAPAVPAISRRPPRVVAPEEITEATRTLFAARDHGLILGCFCFCFFFRSSLKSLVSNKEKFKRLNIGRIGFIALNVKRNHKFLENNESQRFSILITTRAPISTGVDQLLL